MNKTFLRPAILAGLLALALAARPSPPGPSRPPRR